ncbi:MAG: ribulose-bisphosphate carboxylase large subunit [Patescibacteria group bacterium]
MYDLNYLALGKKFNPKNNIFVTFFVDSSLGDREAAAAIATESSIGTWTKVKTQNKKKFDQLAAKVYYIDFKKNIFKVAYPLDLFEPGNIPQLLSSIAGNIYSLKEIKHLKLLDFELPGKYVRSFAGPAFGLEEIRKLTGIRGRPLIGSIMKPKLGLSATQHAQLAYEVLSAGADLVKDDENLTDQKFNPFKERVVKTLALVKKVEKTSPTRKLVAFNVTAETGEMIKRARFVKTCGGRCVMIDIVTCGFSGVLALRRANLGLIIHGHRAMHSAFTRESHHGLSILVLSKLARLAGVDQLHSGTIVGKMEGGREQVLNINNFLTSNWHGLKKTLPIASGGLHPALIPRLISLLGKDVVLNFGGGIYGHPQGARAGVLAVRQALEAVKKDVSLKKYSLTHQELETALKHF